MDFASQNKLNFFIYFLYAVFLGKDLKNVNGILMIKIINLLFCLKKCLDILNIPLESELLNILS